jgi:serine/threonine protein kinase
MLLVEQAQANYYPEMLWRISRGEKILNDFSLDDGEYVIGSSETAHLQVTSDSVAPEHARFKVAGDIVEVEDLGSGLGTWLGKQPVRGMQRLAEGTVIQIGDVAVQFWDDEAARDEKRGRFVVGPVVASGAMGVIRSAREVNSGREVAMKQMVPGIEDPILIARFVQEAKITAHLEHPNVVPVHEVNPGTDGAHYYTMKMVRGESLDGIFSLLKQGSETALQAYPLEVLLTVFQKVCDALAFAHSKGVIHRDLKPANIMVGEFGEVLVMDWGLAKLAGDAAAELVRDSPDAFGLLNGESTLAGTILGTPRYMAPEQASGETDSVDERSDVYALGAILYHLLTLRAPVEGGSVQEVLRRVCTGEIIPPLQRVGSEELPHLPGGRIPASLSAVSMKALSLSPESRYQRVLELQAEIRAYQSGFATGAEGAGAARHFMLLLKRHKGASIALAASLLVLASSSAFYIASVVRARNEAVASENRAIESAEVARLNEEAAKKAQHESEENARLAERNAAEATANAELAKQQSAIAIAAKEEADVALDKMKQAQSMASAASEKEKLATSTAKTADQKAILSLRLATAAQREAEQAKVNRLTERVASLPGETDAAALKGDAGVVLVNSVFLLERETDPAQQILLRRRIGAALRQMPRLLFMKDGAKLARISPNGSRGVFFEGGRGTLFEPASLRPVGPSLSHGPNGSAEAVEFGADSRVLITAGAVPSKGAPPTRTVVDLTHLSGVPDIEVVPGGQPNVWMWNASNGAALTPRRWNLQGNLERFLPYPDRSRVVTIHAVPNSPKKEITIWAMDGVTPAANTETTLVDGIVTALIPLRSTNEFLLQSFTPAVGDRSNFIYKLERESVTIRCEPVRDPFLARASSISPDGTRAVQLSARQLRLTEALPPDANGRIVGPQVLSFLKGTSGAGVPLHALSGEQQELIDVKIGRPIGRTLTGGASTFSPDSKLLLMGDGAQAWLHHAVGNDPAGSSKMELPGRARTLAFSADSSQAIIGVEGGQVILWNTKNRRKTCPDILLHSEVREISTTTSGRLVFASGDAVTLWDTAPLELRAPVEFRKLSSFATWVSGDGRRAVAIPPPALSVAPGTGAPAANVLEIGASASSLTLHDLENPQQEGRTVARRAEIPAASSCWLTRNGRFFLIWGANEGARIWDLEKRTPRSIFPDDRSPTQRRKYANFYDGRNVIVVENPKDNTLALAKEGAGPDKFAITSLFFDGTTGNELADQKKARGGFVYEEAGLLRVNDLDGKATLARAASVLQRELPPDARRAFFREDGKLVAILSTSAAEEPVVRPVLSELLYHSDLIGKTADKAALDGRQYGFAAPAGRAWHLQVYDVATRTCLVSNVTLPALAAFRWEGDRCIALASDGRWTEIDLSPDQRPIADLRDAAAVLTGRGIDPVTGSVAPVKESASALTATWQRLRQAYPNGWQVPVK